MGAQPGVLQGERRWGPLALVYLAQGLGRLFLGLGLIVFWPTEFAAMAGVALGCWLPVIIGALALSRPRTDVAHSEGHPGLDLHPRGRAQQPGAARLLRAVQRRHPGRPRHHVGLPGRPLRRRADHGQGGPVPAAVRGGLRLPLHVQGGDQPAHPPAGHGALGRPRRGRRRSACWCCPTSRCSSWAARTSSRSRTTCGSSRSSAPCSSMVQLLVYSALARRQGRAVIIIWTALALLVAGALAVTRGHLAGAGRGRDRRGPVPGPARRRADRQPPGGLRQAGCGAIRLILT